MLGIRKIEGAAAVAVLLVCQIEQFRRNIFIIQ